MSAAALDRAEGAGRRDRIHAIEVGRGLPIALLHPNPLDAWAWMYQLAHFSTWFHVIAVDLPGYGLSAAAPDDITVPLLGELVWERLMAITSPPIVVAGVSLGARVAKEIAARHPDDVAALILSGTRGPGGSREFARQRAAAFDGRGLAYRAEYARELLAPASRSGPVADFLARLYEDRASLADLSSIVRMYAASEEAPEPPPEASIACPTLVIAGSEDKAWAGSVEMAKAIADCEHVTIDGAGHAPNIDHPAEYDAHVLRFLAGHGLLPSQTSTSDVEP
jgi:pimeloyl-ACP methyl ester carboxylesterase